MQICPMDLSGVDGDDIFVMGIYFLYFQSIFHMDLWRLQFQRSRQTEHRLSTWRSVGSTLASLVIGTGTPLVAYVTVDGNPVLSGSRMTIIAGVFSVLAVICYLLCFKLVSERVPVPANNQKFDIGTWKEPDYKPCSGRNYCGSTASASGNAWDAGDVRICIPKCYRSTQAQSVVALLSNIAIIAICAPLAGKLASRFGKKELATVCLIGAVSYLFCLIIHPDNVWVYVAFYVMSLLDLDCLTWSSGQ